MAWDERVDLDPSESMRKMREEAAATALAKEQEQRNQTQEERLAATLAARPWEHFKTALGGVAPIPVTEKGSGEAALGLYTASWGLPAAAGMAQIAGIDAPAEVLGAAVRAPKEQSARKARMAGEAKMVSDLDLAHRRGQAWKGAQDAYIEREFGERVMRDALADLDVIPDISEIPGGTDYMADAALLREESLAKLPEEMRHSKKAHQFGPDPGLTRLASDAELREAAQKLQRAEHGYRQAARRFGPPLGPLERTAPARLSAQWGAMPSIMEDLQKATDEFDRAANAYDQARAPSQVSAQGLYGDLHQSRTLGWYPTGNDPAVQGVGVMDEALDAAFDGYDMAKSADTKMAQLKKIGKVAMKTAYVGPWLVMAEAIEAGLAIPMLAAYNYTKITDPTEQIRFFALHGLEKPRPLEAGDLSPHGLEWLRAHPPQANQLLREGVLSQPLHSALMTERGALAARQKAEATYEAAEQWPTKEQIRALAKPRHRPL